MVNVTEPLKLHQKPLIVKEHDRCCVENRKRNQTDFAQWAQDTLNLQKRRNQASISTILKASSEFKDLRVGQSIAFKKRRSAAAHSLAEALYK